MSPAAPALDRSQPTFARIHLNTAGAGMPSSATRNAIRRHLLLEARLGPMEAAAQAAATLRELRIATAALINADTDEIAFVSSGSAAFGCAFAALAPLRTNDRILIGRHEWGGNVATYQRAAQRAGARVEVIPCRPDGSVDTDALAVMLDARVRLVSLTWLPANGGLINDAAAIGRLTRSAGIPFLIDAGQALGQIPVDVRALGCDILKSAARKHLHGPRGTAVLYVRRGFLSQLDPAWVDVTTAPWRDNGFVLESSARRFETSEQSVALLCGLAQAVAEVRAQDPRERFARIQALGQSLRDRLAVIAGVTGHDLGGAEKSGIVAFNLAYRSADEVKTLLADAGINVGANGVAYTPFDMRARGLTGIVRASFCSTSTTDDIDALVDALTKIVARGSAV